MAAKKATKRTARRKTAYKASTNTHTVALVGGLFGVGIAVVGIAALLSTSDSGAIDVAKAIRESSQRVIVEGETAGTNQQAAAGAAGVRPDLANKVNGGLVPQSGAVNAPSTPEPAPVATTTDDVASSTDAVASSTSETVAEGDAETMPDASSAPEDSAEVDTTNTVEEETSTEAGEV
ncbi:MAG: hypothetical protein LR017_03895 [Candidatus Pacebacteria bacterium]|nr:hypothetical protein [Candidatus Paceibacterota bacterium]